MASPDSKPRSASHESSAPSQRSSTDMGYGSEYGSWKYTILPEPRLASKLARLSSATRVGNADCVSLQPCPNPEEASQDRYVVQNWQLAGGVWRFAAIFDGHAGTEMVDHTVQNLPSHVRGALEAFVKAGVQRDNASYSSDISTVLSSAISGFDDSSLAELQSLFPGGLEEIATLSDKEISSIVNSPENVPKVVRGMRGTTALLSLVDPSGENLWVASLGDCQAALGTKNSAGKWNASLLSSNHNGDNPAEAERVRKEHPGEPECILRNRVFGAMALTRAIGDYVFRLPRVWADRVFRQSKIPFRFHSVVQEFIVRNLTPPYMNNEADVRHVRLKSSGNDAHSEHLLVMCSDGLVDLYSDRDTLQESATHWVKVVGQDGGDGNLALRLLRDALGGGDLEKVSRMLTVEMFERWMDDTTIIVQRL